MMDAGLVDWQPPIPNNVTAAIGNLVRALAAKSPDKRIVVLVDEYDAPIVDLLVETMGQPTDRIQSNISVLQKFFSALKGSDTFIHRVVVTGVSKFARTALFSSLDPVDVSLDPRFNDIVGYTWAEIEAHFESHLAALGETLQLQPSALQGEIERWYNGYNWTGLERIYNPFSINRLFNVMKLQPYWSKLGMPKWLLNLVNHPTYGGTLPAWKGGIIGTNLLDASMDSAGGVRGSELALLFQTGYLTIKAETDTEFDLQPPNKEVSDFVVAESLKLLLRSDTLSRWGGKSQLLEGDVEGYIHSFLQNVVAPIPFSAIKYKNLREIEGFWQSQLFTALCFDIGIENVRAGVNVFRGEVDLAISLPQALYIIEVKVHRPTKSEKGDDTKRGENSKLNELRVMQSNKQRSMLLHSSKLRSSNVRRYDCSALHSMPTQARQ